MRRVLLIQKDPGSATLRTIAKPIAVCASIHPTIGQTVPLTKAVILGVPFRVGDGRLHVGAGAIEAYPCDATEGSSPIGIALDPLGPIGDQPYFLRVLQGDGRELWIDVHFHDDGRRLSFSEHVVEDLSIFGKCLTCRRGHPTMMSFHGTLREFPLDADLTEAIGPGRWKFGMYEKLARNRFRLRLILPDREPKHVDVRVDGRRGLVLAHPIAAPTSSPDARARAVRGSGKRKKVDPSLDVGGS